MHIRLKNDVGMIKECKVGFSWTTLFFGFFVALFRGDLKWSAAQLVCSLITWNISSIIFGFIYNKIYINELLKSGFKPIAESDKNILISKNFIAGNY